VSAGPITYACRDCGAPGEGDRWSDPGRCRCCGGSRWTAAEGGPGPRMAPSPHVYEVLIPDGGIDQKA